LPSRTSSEAGLAQGWGFAQPCQLWASGGSWALLSLPSKCGSFATILRQVGCQMTMGESSKYLLLFIDLAHCLNGKCDRTEFGDFQDFLGAKIE
jgi:hypothetical protein